MLVAQDQVYFIKLRDYRQLTNALIGHFSLYVWNLIQIYVIQKYCLIRLIQSVVQLNNYPGGK